ncbi:PKD domain-containing protein [Candidatus Venteria ishoeyi]|nr:hypothetical protein [Candidatus Venteria ishoeyi]
MYDNKPAVDAGVTINIADAASTANLNATALDSDGYIDTILWEQITPATPLATISNNAILNPALSNLTEDEYEFKITVTDNDGFTANDTVGVIRDKIYGIALTKILDESDTSGMPQFEKQNYILETSPVLNASDVLLLNANSVTTLMGDGLPFGVAAYIIIRKNGVAIHGNINSINYGDDDWNGSQVVSDIDFQFSLIASDVVVVEIYSYVKVSPTGTAAAEFSIESVVFTGSSSTNTTLPLTVSNSI